MNSARLTQQLVYEMAFSQLGVTLEEKAHDPTGESNPGPFADRASTLTTEIPGHTVRISPCLNRFVTELLGTMTETNETVNLLLAARARTHTSQGEVKTDRDSNRASTLTTEL